MRLTYLSIFCVVTSLAACFGVACGDAPQQGQSRWTAEVKRLAQPVIDGGLVPSLAIGIYDNGRIETLGLGVLDKERPTAPDASTMYEIGSISKVFTALMLADAVSRSEVGLDDPLSKFLPKGVEAPKRDGKEITLEQLATHFSGLPRIPTNMPKDSLVNPYADYSKEKLFAFLNGLRLSRSPGAEYEYSNLGAGLLGTVLADKAGKSYDDLLRERLTTPLKMADTSVRLSEDQQKRLAPGHRAGLPAPNWDFGTLAGCGGVRSNVNDLLKLVAAHIDPAGSPLKASITLAEQRRRDVPQTRGGIALGWHIAADGSTLWHTGQTGGYSAGVFVSPLLKKGVVVLSNGADTTVDALAEKIFQTVAGMKVDPPSVRRSIPVTEAQLESLVGEYPSKFGFTISVTREGEALLARLTGQQALRVYPESPTLFFYRDVKAELEFDIDGQGPAKAVTLFQNGQKIRCERK